MKNPFGIAILSTGDPVKDAEELAHATKTAANTAEGLCPNGCSAMNPSTDPNLRGCWECPVCHCVTNYDPMRKRNV